MLLRKVSIRLFIFNAMLLVVNRQFMNFAADVASRRSDEAVSIKSISTSPFCCVRFSPQSELRQHWKTSMHFLEAIKPRCCFQVARRYPKQKACEQRLWRNLNSELRKELSFPLTKLFAELTHGWVYRTLRSVSSHQSPRNLIYECVCLVRARASRAFDRSRKLNNENNDKNRQFINYQTRTKIFAPPRLPRLILKVI